MRLNFPLLTALAAGTKLQPAVERICKLSGDISYPLYMVHYLFIWVYLSYTEEYKPSLQLLGLLIPLFTITLILFAYVVMKFVDEPVRKYFGRKR